MEILNFSLYLLLFVWVWKRRKKNYTLLFLISIWLISAFVGIFYVRMDVYREGDKIELFPFLYLFMLFVIFLIPLFRQKVSLYKISYKNEKILDLSALFIGLLSLWPFFEFLIRIGYSIKTGEFFLLGSMYDSVGRGESERLIQLTRIGSILTNVSMMFKVISPVLFLYYVSKFPEKKVLALFMFVNAIIPSLSNVSSGGKTQIVFFLFYLSTLFLFAKGIFTLRQKAKLTNLLVSCGVTVLALILILSVSRYYLTERVNSVSDTGDFLFKYTAESMYNFNQLGYHEEKTLDGYMTMSSVFADLGLSEIRYTDIDNKYLDVINYFGSKMKSSPWLFYTLFGDVYLDFGLVATIFIFVIISYIVSSLHIKIEMDLSNVILLSLYFYIATTSLFYFCFKTSFRPIYMTLLYCIFLKFASEKMNPKSRF